jgi:predicted site-specific integrase-resolvase
MSTLLNRPQLAGRAEVCDATICKLVRNGSIRPDALDAKGRWLFSENRVAEVQSKIRRKPAIIL